MLGDRTVDPARIRSDVGDDATEPNAYRTSTPATTTANARTEAANCSHQDPTIRFPPYQLNGSPAEASLAG